MCATPQINLSCCPTDADTGISDAEQYHTYSELTNPQDPLSKDQWDDLGSSTTPCSQTSEDEAKTSSPVKAETFPTSKKDDLALPKLNLITTSTGDTEAGKQAAESSQPYAGIHDCSQSCQRVTMDAWAWWLCLGVEPSNLKISEGRHTCGQGVLLPFVPSRVYSVPVTICSFC